MKILNTLVSILLVASVGVNVYLLLDNHQLNAENEAGLGLTPPANLLGVSGIESHITNTNVSMEDVDFMHTALTEIETQLKEYAARIQLIIDQQKEARIQLAELRERLANGEDVQGQIDELTARIQELQEESVVAQFDLQKAYEDYQAVNTLSEIMKKVQDEARKIIDNMK